MHAEGSTEIVKANVATDVKKVDVTAENRDESMEAVVGTEVNKEQDVEATAEHMQVEGSDGGSQEPTEGIEEKGAVDGVPSLQSEAIGDDGAKEEQGTIAEPAKLDSPTRDAEKNTEDSLLDPPLTGQEQEEAMQVSFPPPPRLN